MKKLIWLLALCLALASIPVLAQVQSGTIAGTVTDEQGGVLPGVTVSLSSADRTSTFVTEADGRFRFLNLPPGTYTLAVTLAGFTTLVREGRRHLGRHQRRSAADPEGGERRRNGDRHRRVARNRGRDAMGTATHFTQSELERIPTSRDPVGAAAHGPRRDGRSRQHRRQRDRPAVEFPVEGHAPAGRSVDDGWRRHHGHGGHRRVADLFQLRQLRGDAGLDVRPGSEAADRRGRLELRRAARHQPVPQATRAATSPTTRSNRTNVPDELKAAGVTAETADHNKQISDYTLDFGGPIVRDKAWFYGSWANQDIRLVRRAGNLIDRTVLKTFNAKGNWQATLERHGQRAVVPGRQGKVRTVTRPIGDPGRASSTWDQGGATYADRQTARVAEVRGQPHVQLEPVRERPVRVLQHRLRPRAEGRTRYERGREPGPRARRSAATSRISTSGRSTPSTSTATTSSTVSALRTRSSSAAASAASTSTIGTVWPGNMIRAFENSATDKRARIYREGLGIDRVEFFSLYAGDSISRGRFTDRRRRTVRSPVGRRRSPSSTRANPAFPDIMPGIVFAGYDTPFTWNDISPRVGVTVRARRCAAHDRAGQLHPLRRSARHDDRRLLEPERQRRLHRLSVGGRQRRSPRAARRGPDQRAVHHLRRRIRSVQPDVRRFGGRRRSEPEGAAHDVVRRRLRSGADAEPGARRSTTATRKRPTPTATSRSITRRGTA